MKQEIGMQYNKDHTTDKTGFKAKARLHQSKFRAEVLKLAYDGHGNYLTKNDGEKGLNFYNGFGILEDVRKKHTNYNRALYSNMLRSEHIPWNFFIPFKQTKQNMEYCKKIFNDLLGNCIKSIDEILIEHAPPEKPLKDKTSFDTYIEYTHVDKDKKSVIGIEVKYTEQEYPIGKKEKIYIEDRNSLYYTNSDNSKLYTQGAEEILRTDEFRQVWRNHLLGESMKIAKSSQYNYFTSMIFFPQGNSHYVHICDEYAKLFREIHNYFKAVTYEDFFSLCKKHCPNEDYNGWLDYLKTRYIVTKV